MEFYAVEATVDFSSKIPVRTDRQWEGELVVLPDQKIKFISNESRVTEKQNFLPDKTVTDRRKQNNKQDTDIRRRFDKIDVIILDPPRKGCDKALIDVILQAKIKKIIYISCDPATLARDIRLLCDGGYTLEKTQPIDMFPMTGKVESVSLLISKS